MPLWMLGSSLGGAQVAAALGLPFSFASHFTPVSAMREALAVYRERFDSSAPTAQVDRPTVMARVHALVAPTTEKPSSWRGEADGPAHPHRAVGAARPAGRRPVDGGARIAAGDGRRHARHAYRRDASGRRRATAGLSSTSSTSTRSSSPPTPGRQRRRATARTAGLYFAWRWARRTAPGGGINARRPIVTGNARFGKRVAIMDAQTGTNPNGDFPFFSS